MSAGREVQGWLARGEHGSGSPSASSFHSILGVRNGHSGVSSAAELRSRTELVDIPPSIASAGQPALSVTLLPLGSGAWRTKQPAEQRGCLPPDPEITASLVDWCTSKSKKVPQ